MWPLLKNSTRISYDFYLDTYLLPKWGSMKLTKMRTIELRDFFNSFCPRLAPKTIPEKACYSSKRRQHDRHSLRNRCE